MAAPQENLEERIERIRKRDEELEKKHREAEEDRLAALKDNAMVKTKTPTSEDWPKVHRYDKFEFSYGNRDTVDGVQPDAVGGGEGGDAGGGQTTGKGGRDYKKFADGQGPPPDPSYNFLADAERDGNAERAAGGVVDNKNKQDWRQQQQGNNGSQQQQQSGQMPNNRSRGGLNNSFKGRNGARAGPRQNGNQGGNARSNKSADSAQEFNQWKSERERIDEARIGRQQLGDGKWRREWDHEKNTTEELNEAVEKINLNQAGPKQQHYKQLPLEQPKTNSQQNYINNNNNSIEMTPKPMEKRGNLMVSVSKDGEVKSVKRELTIKAQINFNIILSNLIPFQYNRIAPSELDALVLDNPLFSPRILLASSNSSRKWNSNSQSSTILISNHNRLCQTQTHPFTINNNLRRSSSSSIRSISSCRISIRMCSIIHQTQRTMLNPNPSSTILHASNSRRAPIYRTVWPDIVSRSFRRRTAQTRASYHPTIFSRLTLDS